jgi:hypothetical protein
MDVQIADNVPRSALTPSPVGATRRTGNAAPDLDDVGASS